MDSFQLSCPLPRSLDTRIYIRVNMQAKSVMIFLTTAAADASATPPPLGSFVYALPDKFNPLQPLSTTLYTEGPTEDFATRVAKLFAKKTQLPVFVSNSISLASTGLGGTVEEEMEAFKMVVGTIAGKLQERQTITNGVSGMSISSS